MYGNHKSPTHRINGLITVAGAKGREKQVQAWKVGLQVDRVNEGSRKGEEDDYRTMALWG